MKHKLFWYMLALALIVLSFLGCGLFFFGHFSTAKESVENNLAFQMRTYERQVSKYFEDMTRMGNSLSYSVAQKTNAYLASEGIAFDDLNDDATRIAELQNILFDKLGIELMKTDCSGAFLMLDATVNTHIDGAEYSKTGLYFQRASLDETDETLLLYRGISDIGRNRDVMPHRQWRLEFNLANLPDGDKVLALFESAEKTPRLTQISRLYGTSERTMNFVVPIVGNNNKVYGVCGFEISENYFKKYFAQSTQLEHLTCMFFPKTAEHTIPSTDFRQACTGATIYPRKANLPLKTWAAD